MVQRRVATSLATVLADAVCGHAQISRSSGHCYQTSLPVKFHCSDRNSLPGPNWQAFEKACAQRITQDSRRVSWT